MICYQITKFFTNGDQHNQDKIVIFATYAKLLQFVFEIEFDTLLDHRILAISVQTNDETDLYIIHHLNLSNLIKVCIRIYLRKAACII